MENLVLIKEIAKNDIDISLQKKHTGRIGLYLCSCGNEVIVSIKRVECGNKVSCGCRYNRSGYHPNYKIWSKMKCRCNNKNHHAYHRYGGRGITVCDRWSDKRSGFSSFVSDMGVRPEGLTLDRIDGDKGYYKENCRWATMKEQQNNKCTNRIIEYDNNKINIAQASELTGIPHHIILWRINAGWEVEKALTTPIRKKTKSQPKKTC